MGKLLKLQLGGTGVEVTSENAFDLGGANQGFALLALAMDMKVKMSVFKTDDGKERKYLSSDTVQAIFTKLAKKAGLGKDEEED